MLTMIMILHEHIMMEDYDFEPTFESPPQLAAQETRPSGKQGFDLKLYFSIKTTPHLTG